MSSTIALKHLQTPLGTMIAGATKQGICLFDFEGRRMLESIMKRIESNLRAKFSEADNPHFNILQSQILEYFGGDRQEFTIPLHFAGSPFQHRVWQALQQIPYGDVRSYKQQSVFLGDVKAIRAVARANGENGIAIIIPCHRVIGENGALTGYGGGLPRKQWLLDHEAKYSGKSGQMRLFANG